MAGDIKVETKLQDAIRALELQSTGAMSRAMDDKIIPLVVKAKREWPKKTGFSASILRLRVELENGRIVKYVEDNAPYAAAIHFKDSEVLAVDRLILEPIEAALAPMLEAFGRELGRG